jgi:hypothetical protein
MYAKIYTAIYGAAIWLVIALVAMRPEAWDNMYYWSFGYPALLLGALVFGWALPGRPWRWGAWIGLGHALTAILCMLIGGSDFGLIPISLLLFMALTLPLMVFSLMGGIVKKVYLERKGSRLGGLDTSGKPGEQKPRA